MPICFHSGNNSFLLEGLYREDSGFAKAKLPLVATFHQLLHKGIPAKFPKLRWAFIEVSAQWIPYALNDLAIRFRRRGEDMSPWSARITAMPTPRPRSRRCASWAPTASCRQPWRERYSRTMPACCTGFEYQLHQPSPPPGPPL